MFIGSEILPDPEPFLRGVTRGPVPDLEPESTGPVPDHETLRNLNWAELAWAKFCIFGRVGMGRVLCGPSWFWAELSCTLQSSDQTCVIAMMFG